MTNPIESITDMASHSTIFKRHEDRKNQHIAAQAPAVHHQPAPDHSINETLAKMGNRSTIYSHHQQHHTDMHHDPHAGERHMAPTQAHHHDTLGETMQNINKESSIFDRNARRNDFLHQK